MKRIFLFICLVISYFLAEFTKSQIVGSEIDTNKLFNAAWFSGNALVMHWFTEKWFK